MLNPLMGLSLLHKIAGGFLIGALLFTTMMWRIEKHGHAKANAHIVKLVAAREADRRAYEAAQVKAAELNKATVQRIETHQQRITANVEADLTSRLERLRSELRKQANQGASRGTGASGVPQGTGSAPGAPTVQISTEDYVYGAELEEKLDQWITWYERQRQVKRHDAQKTQDPPSP